MEFLYAVFGFKTPSPLNRSENNTITNCCFVGELFLFEKNVSNDKTKEISKKNSFQTKQITQKKKKLLFSFRSSPFKTEKKKRRKFKEPRQLASCEILRLGAKHRRGRRHTDDLEPLLGATEEY